ncbi:hypothetical protein OJF2_74180 [Aquisphaera giovannonii]|uniref:Peptidoglycan binding domain protein n=1 Tax=Aquisphaera giovannonii TaxID=406548 RepID=A0A5B9WDR5_9BACT|nr:peptidoglycan-binding domain-containing protein [Aquisphaera giovannonii]QEH38808.1 hypothetical protein OJF2_74180 [Aquisphaera giovannonii]
MPLRSRLFGGDSKLEAASQADSAHVTPGARGEHVSKIQKALNLVDGAGLDEDGIYGNGTARAVLRFKQARGIVNRAYQSQADDIVGRMTVAALDREVFAREGLSGGRIRIVPLHPILEPIHPTEHIRRSPGLLLGFKVEDLSPRLGLSFSSTSLRLEPRNHAVVTIANGGGGSVTSRNTTKARDCLDKTTWIYDLFTQKPIGVGAPEDGGSETIRGDAYNLIIWAFRPGDATITASPRGGGSPATLQVQVRAPSTGAVTGYPAPTKADPGSKGYVSAKDSEDSANKQRDNACRPVKPKVGEGRNINLGGEYETPGFEDYTTSLPHSGFSGKHTGDRWVFRPWTDDPQAGVGNSKALNICSRGTPLDNDAIASIRRMAAKGCRITYCGEKKHIDALKTAFPGHTTLDDLVIGSTNCYVMELP